jgi:Domain of unknown function (DUF4277)
MLGSLPVVAQYCRRLDLAGIVDRACPVRDLALLTHGQVIEALVANRLTSPAPLLRVEEWARGWAVEETFGSDPAALNDDRIGRALDAIAELWKWYARRTDSWTFVSLPVEASEEIRELAVRASLVAAQCPGERRIAAPIGQLDQQRRGAYTCELGRFSPPIMG